MIRTLRTNAGNTDFVELVKELDAYLAKKDGDDHSFYSTFNTIAQIKYVVVAYEDTRAVGCGAIKAISQRTMEVKRMYVSPESRGKGIARQVLSELEHWAAELGCNKCVLETGKRQPEAIRLYQDSGYIIIPNYGQYAGVENSVCFEKTITQ